MYLQSLEVMRGGNSRRMCRVRQKSKINGFINGLDVETIREETAEFIYNLPIERKSTVTSPTEPETGPSRMAGNLAWTGVLCMEGRDPPLAPNASTSINKSSQRHRFSSPTRQLVRKEKRVKKICHCLTRVRTVKKYKELEKQTNHPSALLS